MGNNKVTYKKDYEDVPVMDYTSLTVSPYNLVSGYTAINANGEFIVGEMPPKPLVDYSLDNQLLDGSLSIVNDDFPEKAKEILSRTVTYISNSQISSVRSYAFFKCSALSKAVFNNARKIGSNAFFCCSDLNTCEFITAETIDFCAFYRCANLETIAFPNAKVIQPGVFEQCSKLKEAFFPELISYIEIDSDSMHTPDPSIRTAWGYYLYPYYDDGAFQECMNLEVAYFPKLENIGAYMFTACFDLKFVTFSNAISINRKGFTQSGLIYGSFPRLIDIGSEAFVNCEHISKLYTPCVEHIHYGAFRGIGYVDKDLIRMLGFHQPIVLTSVSFPNLKRIEERAFRGCGLLESIYLLGSSVAVLDNINAFDETPLVDNEIFSLTGYNPFNEVFKALNQIDAFLGAYSEFESNPKYGSYYNELVSLMPNLLDFYGGNITIHHDSYASIYVRASLYDDWRTAENWSYFSDRFVSLTSSEIEALPGW